jgi:hypothetical protein
MQQCNETSGFLILKTGPDMRELCAVAEDGMAKVPNIKVKVQQHVLSCCILYSFELISV